MYPCYDILTQVKCVESLFKVKTQGCHTLQDPHNAKTVFRIFVIIPQEGLVSSCLAEPCYAMKLIEDKRVRFYSWKKAW